MVTVLEAGEVRPYDAWAQWRDERRVRSARTRLPAFVRELIARVGPVGTMTVAVPDADWCPTCAGQRRIMHPAGNGEGLVPRTCAACLGTGFRPRVAD